MTAMATPEQTQTQVCYRHPRTETAVSCSNCGRPICTDCMVFSAVGIKCPECAGSPARPKRAATRVRSVAGTGTGFVVLLNLAFTFAVGYVSIGAHVGGLIGGALTVLVLSRWGRGHAVYGRVDVLSAAGLVGIAVVSIGLAYLRARG